jgi:hypothetical protein
MTVEYLQQKPSDCVFIYDQDLVLLQEGYGPEFHALWRQAFAAYVTGNWTDALLLLGKCSAMFPEDGPTDNLTRLGVGV